MLARTSEATLRHQAVLADVHEGFGRIEYFTELRRRLNEDREIQAFFDGDFEVRAQANGNGELLELERPRAGRARGS